MADVIKAACLQLNAGPDIAENTAITAGLIRKAAADGAQLIATPENTCHISFPFTKRLASAKPQEEHETLHGIQKLAQELGVWVLIGSLGIKLEKRKLANRTYLISDKGTIAATYDKIHLFDVDLPNAEKYRESAIIQPGNKAVIADCLGLKIGFSICYDVRFASLYRALAKNGAHILSVPAAFSMPTGEAHWETLLRARAIETGSFVLAPAQVGEHEGGRQTWGHSMIINPWGEILAEIGTKAGIIAADLNMKEVERARTAIPALQHDKDFSVQS